jgi:tetratricopeptide (TPR) repeat protein
MGKVKMRVRKNSDAITLLSKVVALQPQSAAAHLDLAICLADSYDLPRALAETTEAVRLAPQSAATHFNRGRILFDLGRNAEAQPEFETASRLAPQMAEPRYFLALIQKQSGNAAQAVTLLETVVKLQPRNAMAWQLLGQSLTTESRSSEAIAAWRKAIAIDPKFSQALWSLARALRTTNPAEARELTDRYAAVQKERRILDQAGTLKNDAVASAQAHDWPEAIRQLKDAIAVCGECAAKPDLHKNLGLIYCQAGDVANGEKELRVAQAGRPADPDIERALTLVARVRAQRGSSDRAAAPATKR